MLEAVNLRKTHKDFIALEGLNLKVGKGGIFCLPVANGAGKTMTINLFPGFIEPTGRSSPHKWEDNCL